jgi:hypothetical protein
MPDLSESAMVKVAATMPEGAHLVATVHDELVLDCPADTAEQCRNIAEAAMKEAFLEMLATPCPWKSTPRCVPTGATSESVLANTHEPYPPR